MVPKLQIVQNRPMDFKVHGCAKDIGSETPTSLSNQVLELLNQKIEIPIAKVGWSWLELWQDMTVEQWG